MAACFRVVIVEDEPRILQYINQKIHILDSRFEVVGTARNGMDAFAMIGELCPDVVFSDVSMPVMDGLELSRRLYEQKSSVKIVIISGFREFDYAREAIRNGVADYLLKPLADAELSNVLMRIGDQLIMEQRETEEMDIRAAVKGSLDSRTVAAIAQGREFQIVFVNIGNLTSGISGVSHAYVFNHIWKKLDWGVILRQCGIAGSGFWVCDGWSAGQKLLIVDKTAGFFERKGLETLLRLLMEQSEGYAVNLCACSYPVPVHRIHQTALNLGAVVGKSLSPGHSCITPPNAGCTEPSSVGALLTGEQLNLFKGHIQSLRYDLANRQLAELLANWDDKKCPQYLIENGLRQLTHALAAIHTDIDENDIYLAEYSVFSSISTGRSLKDALTEIWDIFECLLLKQTATRDYSKKTVEDIEAYLREHYTENLSAENVADAIGFHVVYLNRIFKKQKQVPLIKYLINLRIEKAKELMREHPDWDLALVGESVGYNDPHYFSRAFKKNTGQSPSEYREFRNR